MTTKLAQALAKKTRPLLFGMIHLRALPRSPLANLTICEIEKIALQEADLYLGHNMDGLIVENMWDVPYSKASDPMSVAAMSRICTAIRRIQPDSLLGVQILAGRNEEAMAVATAAELDLIRAEGFVFGHLGDEGWAEASAASLLRYRKAVGADGVAVLCDVKKKHSAHAVTADVSLGETVAAVEFFLGDGVVVTGSATGDPPKAQDVRVFIGSGVSAGNVGEFRAADGLIVGSDFKKDGHWRNDLDPRRISLFMAAFEAL